MTTFAYADAGDGTGGVVTVSGSSGATNTLWVSFFQGNNHKRTFTAVGTRVGDGAINLESDALGPFLAFVQSVSGGSVTVSDPKGYRVSDSEKALHERILIAVRQYVLSLNLPGVPTDPDLHVMAKLGTKLDEVLAAIRHAFTTFRA